MKTNKKKKSNQLRRKIAFLFLSLFLISSALFAKSENDGITDKAIDG